MGTVALGVVQVGVDSGGGDSQEAGEGEGRSKSDRAPQGVRLCLDIKHEVY